MRNKTAVYILQDLAKQGYLTVEHTTFSYSAYPQPVDPNDVKDAFDCLRDYIGSSPRSMLVSQRVGLQVWTADKLFEKLFDLIFVKQKVWPKKFSDNVEGHTAPLPNLFIGAEKTQIRQIPLAEKKPWPFKFLLELGGMIVVRPMNKRDMLLELRQYLNNFPQFRIKVDAKEWPDGSICIFTWWFETVPKNEKKGNMNVPG